MLKKNVFSDMNHEINTWLRTRNGGLMVIYHGRIRKKNITFNKSMGRGIMKQKCLKFIDFLLDIRHPQRFSQPLAESDEITTWFRFRDPSNGL